MTWSSSFENDLLWWSSVIHSWLDTTFYFPMNSCITSLLQIRVRYETDLDSMFSIAESKKYDTSFTRTHSNDTWSISWYNYRILIYRPDSAISNIFEVILVVWINFDQDERILWRQDVIGTFLFDVIDLVTCIDLKNTMYMHIIFWYYRCQSTLELTRDDNHKLISWTKIRVRLQLSKCHRSHH